MIWITYSLHELIKHKDDKLFHFYLDEDLHTPFNSTPYYTIEELWCLGQVYRSHIYSSKQHNIIQ